MDFRFECPHVAPSMGSTQFAGDPDLIFLREDLADELGAIVGYMECASQIKDYRISERFRETAGDETGHYILLMRLLASIDPVQAEELKKQGLVMLTGLQDQALPYGISGSCKGCFSPERSRRESSDHKFYPVDERILECLRNAIRDEFHAINAYQKQILATANPAVQSLLAGIMNKEKEHVSEFTRIFYDLYHET
ncbi:MAG: hypothetical protein ACM3X9_03225 [Bacillota bacterium]